MKDYRNYEVWKKAHRLVLEMYKATRSLPPQEMYGLTSQLRRACASIPANIAEGSGRGSDAELARFLNIALGSANEVEYFILLAKDLAFFGLDLYEALTALVTEVRRMLSSLCKKVKASAS
jgi:four helix bundle protein